MVACGVNHPTTCPMSCSMISTSIMYLSFCFAIILAFIVASDCTNDCIAIASGFASLLKNAFYSSVERPLYVSHFDHVLILKMSGEIVGSPRTREVFHVGGYLPLPCRPQQLHRRHDHSVCKKHTMPRDFAGCTLTG
jgi:hypothetical protein